jgi:hypothetical protein
MTWVNEEGLAMTSLNWGNLFTPECVLLGDRHEFICSVVTPVTKGDSSPREWRRYKCHSRARRIGEIASSARGGLAMTWVNEEGLAMTSLNWGNLFTPECVLQSRVRWAGARGVGSRKK